MGQLSEVRKGLDAGQAKRLAAVSSTGGVFKADRDQNSSVPTSAKMVLPKISGRSSTTSTRSGVFSGKSRGVGRHLTRDQNSTPGATKVRTPTLRDINGKFAGEGQGVKVFHPTGGVGRRGAVHSSGAFHTVKKSDTGKGMLGEYDLANMQAHAGNRVGRRIAR